jgi:hypothetical protein
MNKDILVEVQIKALVLSDGTWFSLRDAGQRFKRRYWLYHQVKKAVIINDVEYFFKM